MTSTSALAPAFACSSWRSSGIAGDAVGRRAASRSPRGARLAMRKAPREIDRSAHLIGSSKRQCRREWPDVDIGDQSLRVLQESVVLAARGAHLEGVDALALAGPSPRCCSPAAGPPPPCSASGLEPGCRSPTGPPVKKPTPRVSGGSEAGRRTVPKALPVNSARARNGRVVPSATRRPADSRVGRVERAVDRPFVGGDPRLRARHEHQRDADHRQDREHEDRDARGRRRAPACPAALPAVVGGICLPDGPTVSPRTRSCGG